MSYLSLLLSIKNCPRKKIRRNKIIAIDFDHNQANLTKRFRCEKTNGKTERLLNHISKYKNLNQFKLTGYFEEIECKKQKTAIDFLPADESLCHGALDYGNKFYENNCLRELCLELSKEYDYVIIDTPPGWEQNIYARSAVEAADCLLPIGSYGDFDSFHGYYFVICDKLPDVRKKRTDMGPDNLGLWINNWKPSDERAIKKMHSEELEYYIRNAQKEDQENLRRGFFDIGNGNNKLRQINYSAWIAKGSCRNPDMKVDLLETFNHKKIREAYSDLLTSIIGEI